jgi:hypothetical protein
MAGGHAHVGLKCDRPYSTGLALEVSTLHSYESWRTKPSADELSEPFELKSGCGERCEISLQGTMDQILRFFSSLLDGPV